MRIASLGSGSRGNATLIEDEDTTILVDLGFSIKETIRRMDRLGRAPDDIAAILVTHEHADHIHGVAAFARKFNTPVYLTPGTYNRKKMGLMPLMKEVNCHRAFRIGGFKVEPVPVPHDAREPCQYIVSGHGRKVGVLTDLGHISPYVEQQYAACDALLLECNHDVEMLANGPYPWALKQRVGGMHGHLSNQQAAGLLSKIQVERLQHLIICHVSEKNNHPDLALAAVQEPVRNWAGELHVADQGAGFDWLEVH
ncbi:MAG: MBL fold metallo-hydrolase [Pseudomonadales bacterium]